MIVLPFFVFGRKAEPIHLEKELYHDLVIEPGEFQFHPFRNVEFDICQFGNSNNVYAEAVRFASLNLNEMVSTSTQLGTSNVGMLI